MQKSFTGILHKRQKVLQKGNRGQVRWLNFRGVRGGLSIVLAIRAGAVREIPWVLELDQDGDSALGLPHYTGPLWAVLGVRRQRPQRQPTAVGSSARSRLPALL